jgi:citrate lyase beta subunit
MATESRFSDFDVILADFNDAVTPEERETQLDALINNLKLLQNSAERLAESCLSLKVLAHSLRQNS